MSHIQDTATQSLTGRHVHKYAYIHKELQLIAAMRLAHKYSKVSIYNLIFTDITDTEGKITPTEPKYSSYIPNFAWQSAEVVKKTFEATTQYI